MAHYRTFSICNLNFEFGLGFSQTYLFLKKESHIKVLFLILFSL